MDHKQIHHPDPELRNMLGQNPIFIPGPTNVPDAVRHAIEVIEAVLRRVHDLALGHT
mgnify:CR=1 FL=1